MKCPECKLEKGCGCEFHKVNARSYKVCTDCKVKIEKLQNNNESKNSKPNVQGV